MDEHSIDILVALIESKQQFLQMLLETGMSWWVSSVAFCAAVVVGIWHYKGHLADLYSENRTAYQAFMTLVSVFLMSVVGYGLWMIQKCIDYRERTQ